MSETITLEPNTILNNKKNKYMRQILSENKTELKHSKNKLFKLKTNDDNFTMQHRISYGTYECHIS